MSMSIALSRGMFAIVDDDDFDDLESYSWCVKPHGRTFYAIRRVPLAGGKQTTISMHRHIMRRHGDGSIDHANGNGLDNRKCNLRFASHRQNMRNTRPQEGKSSQYKGVSFRQCGKKKPWVARITLDGARRVSLGYFETEEEAGAAYADAASKHYGEFARSGK